MTLTTFIIMGTYVHKVNREMTKNSLYFGGFEEFNFLPSDVKKSISVILFKINLSKH